MSDVLPPPSPVQVPQVETPPLAAMFGLAVGVVVVASLYLARDVLLPITLATLLSFLLAPLVRLLKRLWLGRVASVLLAAFAAIGIVGLLGGVIGTQIASLADDIPLYRSTIDAKVHAIEGFATRGMEGVLRGYMHSVASGVAPTDPITGKTVAKPLLVRVQQTPPSPLLMARQVLMPALSPLASVGIIFVVAIFLLLQQQDLRDRMIRLFGSGDLHRTTLAIDDAATRLSRYFLTQLGINTAFGIIIGGGLALIGVPSAVLWGVIATLLRFVPYVGAFIAASLPLLLAAAVQPGWSMVIYTALLFGGVEAVIGQVVEPLLYGNSTGLSPFAVIVAAIFWSWLWGPIGLIISTPITLCLVVLGRHVPRLEFLDVLLGDRPALSPVESFYQRMLADDPDEAQAHAETLLRDRALSSYYDEVALKGLVLATNDAERGVLGPDRLRRIGVAMDGLIEELAAYEDVEPNEPARQDPVAIETLTERRLPHHAPPGRTLLAPLHPAWQEGTPVLCLAGRGPLDEVAARMLAQLLGKHGIGARVASYAAASRTTISSLDLAGVEMVCVTYLSVEGAPPNLRYLIGRLRRRLPSAPLLVGMWVEGEAILSDPALRAALGADICVASLGDAVQACLDAACRPAVALAAG